MGSLAYQIKQEKRILRFKNCKLSNIRNSMETKNEGGLSDTTSRLLLYAVSEYQKEKKEQKA